MVSKKQIRTRGKFQLSRYFQRLKQGDFVSVVKEPAVQSVFPKRLQGKTGVVENRRGKSYLVKIKDQNKLKSFLIEPIHLRKIKLVNS